MKHYLIKTNEFNEELEVLEINVSNAKDLMKWIDNNEGYYDNFTLFSEKTFNLLRNYNFKKIKKINLKKPLKKSNYYKWDEV